VVFTDPQAASVGAAEATFSATAPVSEVAKTATYTRAYDDSNRFITLLSDGERLPGAYALGPEAGEWLQQATLAIRARVPLEVLRDTIQPFPHVLRDLYRRAESPPWTDHDSVPAGRGGDTGQIVRFWLFAPLEDFAPMDAHRGKASSVDTRG
jgi:dihydrolipoamide dehydrogenase